MKLESRICAHFLWFLTSIALHLEQYVYSAVTTQKYIIIIIIIFERHVALEYLL